MRTTEEEEIISLVNITPGIVLIWGFWQGCGIIKSESIAEKWEQRFHKRKETARVQGEALKLEEEIKNISESKPTVLAAAKQT